MEQANIINLEYLLCKYKDKFVVAHMTQFCKFIAINVYLNYTHKYMLYIGEGCSPFINNSK